MILWLLWGINMKSNAIIAKSRDDINKYILSTLNEMWKAQIPKYKRIIVKTGDREIVVAGLVGDNFMVNWENLIKGKTSL